MSDFLYQRGATIYEAAQHRDPLPDQFFMRVEFEEVDTKLPSLELLNQDFKKIADNFKMQWQFFDLQVPTKILLAVSKHGHCLNDILHRWDSGSLPGEIVAVVSNHEDMRSITEWHELPFYYLPITSASKATQERQIPWLNRGT